MKKERGITLIALCITIMIMIILVSAGIKYGSNSYSSVQLQNFSYEMQQIQGRVDAVYEKMSMEHNPNYIFVDGDPLGTNITNSSTAVNTLKTVKNINYFSSELQTNEELYNSLYYKLKEGSNIRAFSYYRFFTAKDLSKSLDIKNAKNSVIINFKTREVISVNGQNFEDKIYYRLEDL